MYLDHFRLQELPFTLTPDTSFFMNRAGYQDALNVLLVALRSGEGFVKVTGEVGTGKTMLCRTLIKTLGPDFATAYLPNPYLRPMTMLLSIGEELGIAYPSMIDQHAFLGMLNKALLDHHRAGRRVVVCLDEAQAIPVETLETLRLLTNLETEKSKLIQVVLFGQPELDEVLAAPSVRQLRQRITFSYEILPLNRPAIAQYVAHRLAVAGYEGRQLFSGRALELLYTASGGIPRLVNILAHKALLSAYGAGRLDVGREQVRAAVIDTTDARKCEPGRSSARYRTWRWVCGGLGGASLLAAVVLGIQAGALGVLP